ncbi:MAG: hypothetical protein M1835_006355 [Candelina submexicana]|nr:MAG: hypothetical protein M1835_006355 [Candelina submexicana]
MTEGIPTSGCKDQFGRPYHEQYSGTDGPSSRWSSSSLGSPSTRKRKRSGALVDAERWFAENNQNVRGSHYKSFFDDDPPFFFNNTSSSKELSMAAPEADRGFSHRLHSKNHIMNDDSHASPALSLNCNCDEFRGVIDDLTIENKKLKKRLKMYGRMQPSHLEVDRLFEIKNYGLSAQQRVDLEVILRRFALNCTKSPERLYPDVAPQDQLQKSDKLPCPESSTVSTSCSRPLDSAYASMPASGQTSAAQSANTRPYLWRSEQPVQSEHEDTRYFHDIPQEPHSIYPSSMSESAKKNLVVKRLEALFTGRGVTDTEHSRPAQQRENSHSAAIADRKAENSGYKSHSEGLREASILPAGIESTSELASCLQYPGLHRLCVSNDPESREVTPGALSLSSSTVQDQRPTRPLDLDLQRAQVAAENVKYMRHLGLSSPMLGLGLTPRENDNWVYLNLLTNMAQLHTMNVTIEFIRQAISGVSAKLELSVDGRKVRWLGGTEGTHINSDFESCSGQYHESLADLTGGTNARINKRRKLARSESSTMAVLSMNSILEKNSCIAGKQSSSNLLNYKPLFFHGIQSSEDDDSMSYDSDSSVSIGHHQHVASNHSVNPQVAPFEETRPSKRKRQFGPIIFYRNADFCTDLSGDPSYNEDDPSGHSLKAYGATHHTRERLPGDRRYGSLEDTISSLQDSPPHFEESGYVDKELPGSLVDFEPPPLRNDETPVKPCSVVGFEASGIGGVQPKDNFLVDVRICHAIIARSSSSPIHCQSANYRAALRRIQTHSNKGSKYSPGCVASDHLQRTPEMGSDHSKALKLSHPLHAPADVIKHEIISANRTALPPSQLPAPSYAYFPASSSGEGDSMASDDDDGTAASADPRLRMTYSAPKLVFPAPPFASIEKSLPSDGGVTDSESDASMDLLAAARALDPDAIAAYEREFDGNMGSSYTEEPYVASSAATVGAGSRFSRDDENFTPTDDD